MSTPQPIMYASCAPLGTSVELVEFGEKWRVIQRDTDAVLVVEDRRFDNRPDAAAYMARVIRAWEI